MGDLIPLLPDALGQLGVVAATIYLFVKLGASTLDKVAQSALAGQAAAQASSAAAHEELLKYRSSMAEEHERLRAQMDQMRAEHHAEITQVRRELTDALHQLDRANERIQELEDRAEGGQPGLSE